eukprot:g2383.t1
MKTVNFVEQYDVSYEVLRDDLEHISEKEVYIEVGGYELGSCQGGGGDWDCSFVECPGTATIQSDENGHIYVNTSFTHNSYDCDCDRTNVTGDCVDERLLYTDGVTWFKTKAALRFTLQKVNPIVSTFSIVDVNGAENNYANTVTSVGETCESTRGTTNQWQGVTLLGTSSGLLVNKGSGDGNSFDTNITVPHVGKFTSTNILRFGFSQHGQSNSTEDVEVTDASFTFNVQNTFSLTDILSIATSSTSRTHCAGAQCALDLGDINNVGYEFIGIGSCWTSSHVNPPYDPSNVGTVTPQACYERCIQMYGAGNCAGFDTRANCRLYSFSGYVDTNRITTTKNCAVNGNAANCDEWTGGNCYAAKIEYASIHFDTLTHYRTACQLDIELPFHFTSVVNEAASSTTITQVVYDPDPTDNADE